MLVVFTYVRGRRGNNRMVVVFTYVRGRRGNNRMVVVFTYVRAVVVVIVWYLYLPM